MNTVVLNEKEYAEERIRNKDLVDGEIFTMQMLARYYYHEHGLRNKKIAEKLREYFSAAYNGYEQNKFYWDGKIDSIASKAGGRQLFCIDCVWITQHELDKIASLNDRNMEQLAFTWLCLSKYYHAKSEKANGWVSMAIGNVFKLANVSCNVRKQDAYIGNLRDSGILEFAKDDGNMNYRVIFTDDDGDNILPVSDFRCLGYEYLKYCGENFIRCADCGILTRGNKNGTKRYCSECSGVTRKGDQEVTCVDCGAVIVVNSKDRETCRCSICKREYQREYFKEYRRKQRLEENVQRANEMN